MSDILDLDISEQDGAAVLRLRGELDFLSATEVEAAVLDTARTAKELVVDLESLTFIDSAGVRLLDRVAEASTRRSSGLRVVAADPGAVRFTLRLCGFPAPLLHTSVAQALEDLRR